MAMRPIGWRQMVVGATGETTPIPIEPVQGTAGEMSRPDGEARPEDAFARIERGVEMNGRLATERPLRVEGEFRGEIHSASAVFVTESGTVEAPIRARSVEIYGAVVGDVVATREVVIHPTGKLHGDVEAPSFVLMRGAFFNGRTKMYRPERTLAQADALPAPEAIAAES